VSQHVGWVVGKQVIYYISHALLLCLSVNVNYIIMVGKRGLLLPRICPEKCLITALDFPKRVVMNQGMVLSFRVPY